MKCATNAAGNTFRITLSDPHGSFEQVHGHFRPLILHIAAGMAPNDADDMSQVVLLKIFQSATQFNEANNQTGWVIRLTRTTCIDYCRGQQRHADADGLHRMAQHRSAERAERERAAEEIDLVRNAVRTLPKKYRAVLNLWLEGYSPVDAAAYFGVSVPSYRSDLYRALGCLRARLGLSMVPDGDGHTSR